MNKNDPQVSVSPWQNVDGIVVVNLDTCIDRFSEFMKTSGRYLPAERVERLSAVDGRKLASFGKAPWFSERTGERARFWGGTAGCALSHKKAILHARERGWRNVLIFEDDAVLEHCDEAGEAVAEALRCVQGRYLLYLGYNRPAPHGEKVADFACGIELWKTEGVLATHAYLIPESMYEILLSYMPDGEADVWEWLSRYRAIDVFYRDFVPKLAKANIYVLHPLVCVQAEGVSEIGGTACNSESMTCRSGPIPSYGVKRVCQRLLSPFRRLKIKLNSVRTHRRAKKGGLPGYKKRR